MQSIGITLEDFVIENLHNEIIKGLKNKIKQNKVENIKHIINGRTTIVILEDGSKGIAKCHPKDEFDKQEGFRVAYARACGKEVNSKEDELKINNELWNKFLNKKVVINCKFKQDEIFLDYLNKKNFKWKDGQRLDEYRSGYNYENYGEDTCFKNNLYGISYSSRNYYSRNKYKIITFEELFNLNPPKQLSDYTNEELLKELENRLK
ncbi:hypothetical protein ACYJ2U_001648 [Clostridium botulinum]